MDAETLGRAFDPFFSTRKEGEGSGWGLAAVGDAMLEHDGAIRVDSSPGEGTKFDLYFPQVARSA